MTLLDHRIVEIKNCHLKISLASCQKKSRIIYGRDLTGFCLENVETMYLDFVDVILVKSFRIRSSKNGNGKICYKTIGRIGMSLEPQLKKHLFRLSPWMAFCSIDSQLNQEFFSFS